MSYWGHNGVILGSYWGHIGFILGSYLYRDFTPIIMENQMEKKMENEMETGII